MSRLYTEYQFAVSTISVILSCLVPVSGQVLFAPIADVIDRNVLPGKLFNVDFDGDGNLDILARGDGTIFFRNDGESFEAPVVISDLELFALGQTDQSGRPSIFLRSKAGGLTNDYRYFYAQLADDTTLGEPIFITRSQSPVAAPADVDGDGDKDFVIYESQGRVFWWEQKNTSLGFTEQNTLYEDESLSFLSGVWVTDFSCDGLPDLIFSSSRDGQSELSFFGRKRGEALEFSPTLGGGAGYGLVQVLEDDPDPCPGLILSNSPTNFVYSRGFLGSLSLPGFEFVQLQTMVDWDGDGDLDYIRKRLLNPAELYLFENSQFNIARGTLPNQTGYDQMLSVDFSGDQKPDFIALYESGVIRYGQQSEAEGAVPEFEKIYEPAAPVSSMISANLNGDSLPDIVTLRSDGDTILYLNEGLGAFSRTQRSEGSGSEIRGVLVAGDFDGKNHEDLIRWDSQRKKIELLLNDGSGAFELLEISELDGNRAVACVADFNQDTFLDFAIAVNGHASAKIFFQNPSLSDLEDTIPSFSEVSIIGYSGTPCSMVSQDYDRDGMLDLLIGGEVRRNGVSQGTVHLVRNSGAFDGLLDALFEDTSLIIEEPHSIHKLAFIDLDGNGVSELTFQTSRTDGTGLVARFRIEGGYGDPRDVLRQNINSNPVLVDLDQDGDRDVIFTETAHEGKMISWRENLGDFRFSSIPRSLGLTGEVWQLLVDDWDGDGDIDVLTTNSKGALSWNENVFGETPLESWAKKHGLTSWNPQSDSDQDGLPLLVEFAFNLNPHQQDRVSDYPGDKSGLPLIQFSRDRRILRANFRFPAWSQSRFGLSYAFQVSNDLKSWRTVRTLRSIVTQTELSEGNVIVSDQPTEPIFGRVLINYEPPEISSGN